ncbi:thioredoxin [Aquibium carbonis]|uniref:Thioredoxin n=1 Tax=Aquibium carbonis TaxID=2495581 RepID=A0A3S0AVK3_9HYPH|nr:thioredoxin [Aquibium carbonis]RST88151.1 thioredoxin [Aquibium carbonis]
MSTRDNPFAGPNGGYDTEVSFGMQPSAPAKGAGELIKDTTTAAFTADVIQESRNQTVLVDFWAPWCGPCKQLTPVLEKAVREAGGAVKLVKMNIDDHPAIAGQLGIQSIPAVIAFRDGRPLDGFMGALPESQVKAFIKKVGGEAADPVEDALADAAAAMQAGDLEAAGAIYGSILQAVPGHPVASGALASLLVDLGDIESAKTVVAEAVVGDKEPAELASARTRIALAEEVAALGDPRELLARLEQNPDDHDARFDLALMQNAQGLRSEAADSLLYIIKADRSWREDGARSQLLKFFEAWGMTDPATLAARRRLSSVLFS